MTKLLKLFWFFSLFGGLAALLWTYASILLDVKVTDEIRVNREVFFYISLFILSAVNFLLYGISKQKILSGKVLLKSWQYTFGLIFNAFFIVSVLFINTFNNSEAYNYNYSGYFIVIFLSLMIIWLMALPVIIIFKKKA